jgi:hypothetical protein
MKAFAIDRFGEEGAIRDLPSPGTMTDPLFGGPAEQSKRFLTFTGAVRIPPAMLPCLSRETQHVRPRVMLRIRIDRRPRRNRHVIPR